MHYAGTGQVIPISIDKNSPIVDARIIQSGFAPIDAKFLLDTGFSSAISFDRDFVESHRFLVPAKTVRSSGATLDGDAHELVGRLTQLQVGRFLMWNALAKFTFSQDEPADSGLAGTIGGEFLRRFNVILDYGKAKLILQPNSHFADPDDTGMTGMAIVANAGKSIGRGWVFGLNEGLDQAGATVGPLIVALVLYLKSGFRTGFGVLLISCVLCLATLVVARLWYPRPQELETESADFSKAKGFPKAYWIYVAVGALIAAGFADFSLISFHFQKTETISQTTITLLCGSDGSGLIDEPGVWTSLRPCGLPDSHACFLSRRTVCPVRFPGQFWLSLTGMALWGIGMGAQSSLLKALLTGVLSVAKRSTGFGLFYTGYGIAWFLGSAAMGLLYDKSVISLITFSVVCQIAALPIFLWGTRESKSATS